MHRIPTFTLKIHPLYSNQSSFNQLHLLLRKLGSVSLLGRSWNWFQLKWTPTDHKITKLDNEAGVVKNL